MISSKTYLLGALCISASQAVVLEAGFGGGFEDMVFDTYVREFFDTSEFADHESFPHFDWGMDDLHTAHEDPVVNKYMKQEDDSEHDVESWDFDWDMNIDLDYDPYARGYYTAEPVQRQKVVTEPKYRHTVHESEEDSHSDSSDEEFELKWHVADGKHDFPGRTDWGEDPDHFNFKKGGLASHNRYNKKLDYSDIIRPNAPKKESRRGKKEDEHDHVFAHPEREEPEALTTDFGKFVRNRDANYGKNVRSSRSSHREEPIPDAFDYSKLDWAVEAFKADNPHEHYDAPELKVKKNPYSRFSYLKSAADFGDEDCVDCESDDDHPLDKPDDVPRRAFDVPKRGARRSSHSHKAEPIEPTLANRDLVRDFDAWTIFNPEEDEKDTDHHHHHEPTPIPEYAPVGRFFREGNTDINDFYAEPNHHKYLPRRTYKEPIPEELNWADWARNIF
jgi:hypothetical protein